MSGPSASIKPARTKTAEISYAISARWCDVHPRVEEHGDAVWVSSPTNLGPYAHRAIGGIISRAMGRPYGLAEVQELDRRIRLIYRPSA